MTNKVQSFQRFKNFRRFRVFVLSYRTNSKRRKRRKTGNLVECLTILLQCVFQNYWLCFSSERASLNWFYVTFRCFRRFRRIDLAGFWRSLLTCQNSEAGISPMILMTDLIDIYTLLPENISFLECSNGPTPILSDIVISLRKSYEIIFAGYFRKIRYLQEIFLRRLGEVTNKIFFWDMYETY